jgi:hypothetical protein
MEHRWRVQVPKSPGHGALRLRCGITVVQCFHSPSCGISSTSHLATRCTQGTNASGLAATVLSTSPAGFTPGLPLVQCSRPDCSPVLASGFDAGTSLSQGWCAARDQQRSRSLMRVNTRVQFPFDLARPIPRQATDRADAPFLVTHLISIFSPFPSQVYLSASPHVRFSRLSRLIV